MAASLPSRSNGATSGAPSATSASTSTRSRPSSQPTGSRRSAWACGNPTASIPTAIPSTVLGGPRSSLAARRWATRSWLPTRTCRCSAAPRNAASENSVDATSGRSRELQADDAGHDQSDRGQAHRLHRLAEQDDAQDGRTDAIDAGPDGIAGTDGQGLERNAQQHDADDHRTDREHRRTEPCETFVVFQSDDPADLAKIGNEKNEPRHGGSSALEAGASRRGHRPR